MSDTDKTTVLSNNYVVLDLAIFEYNNTTYLATAGIHKSIDIWDVKNKTIEYTLNVYDTDYVSALCIFKKNDDEIYLIISNSDSTIKIYDFNMLKETKSTESSCCVGTFKGHINWISSLVIFNKDENTCCLASSSHDNSIKIWDIILKHCLTTLIGHSDSILSLCKFYDKKKPFLASSSIDKAIKIWDLDTYTLYSTLNGGHDNRINSLVVVDNKYLISGSEDETIRIWDLNDDKKEEEMNVLQCSSPLRSLETVYDDKNVFLYLISGHRDGTIKFWSLDDDDDKNSS